MNCTRKEFEDKVFAKYPNKVMSLDKTSSNETLFALNSFDQCTQDLLTRHMLSDYVWRDGTVIKDRDGLFATITMPKPKYGPGFTITLKQQKCECGAHAVGSNRHSSWCQINDDEGGVRVLVKENV